VESLGVEAIWLSPFFPSPMADFGYDIADHTGVDPLFGTLEDFDRLVEEAHARGIRVLIDWVPNHTSDQHPWFRDSRSSRDSPRRGWYVWRDSGPDGSPPNDWRSDFPAVGPAWTWDEHTRQWYLHSFMAEQPDLDWENPEVEAAMHETLRFWLDRGVDGFRIDVIHKLGKDPELRDNSGSAVPRHEDWPTVHERVRGIRRVVDEYEDRMIVGEVHLLDLRRIVEYLNTGDELHLAHNFVFLHLPWDAGAFGASIAEFEELAEDVVWPAWFLSNHDHSRIATRYDDGGHGRARARVAALMLATLRGTPFMFQGDELGLPDAEIPSGAAVDVDGRDPERAPIPWRPPSDAGAGAGFTTGMPWLPVTGAAEELAAARQRADPGSMLTLSRRLGWLRRGTRALQVGEQRPVDAGPGVLAYVREDAADRLLVTLNLTGGALVVDASGAGAGTARLELSTDPGREAGPVSLHALELGGDEGLLLRLE
jgi:alpha-glucosidase